MENGTIFFYVAATALVIYTFTIAIKAINRGRKDND